MLSLKTIAFRYLSKFPPISVRNDIIGGHVADQDQNTLSLREAVANIQNPVTFVGVRKKRSLIVGKDELVEWDIPTKLVSSATLEYTDDGGQTWQVIFRSIWPHEEHLWRKVKWTVPPSALGKQVAFRITNSDQSLSVRSEAYDVQSQKLFKMCRELETPMQQVELADELLTNATYQWWVVQEGEDCKSFKSGEAPDPLDLTMDSTLTFMADVGVEVTTTNGRQVVNYRLKRTESLGGEQTMSGFRGVFRASVPDLISSTPIEGMSYIFVRGKKQPLSHVDHWFLAWRAKYAEDTGKALASGTYYIRIHPDTTGSAVLSIYLASDPATALQKTYRVVYGKRCKDPDPLPPPELRITVGSVDVKDCAVYRGMCLDFEEKKASLTNSLDELRYAFEYQEPHLGPVIGTRWQSIDTIKYPNSSRQPWSTQNYYRDLMIKQVGTYRFRVRVKSVYTCGGSTSDSGDEKASVPVLVEVKAPPMPTPVLSVVSDSPVITQTTKFTLSEASVTPWLTETYLHTGQVLPTPTYRFQENDTLRREDTGKWVIDDDEGWYTINKYLSTSEYMLTKNERGTFAYRVQVEVEEWAYVGTSEWVPLQIGGTEPNPILWVKPSHVLKANTPFRLVAENLGGEKITEYQFFIRSYSDQPWDFGNCDLASGETTMSEYQVPGGLPEVEGGDATSFDYEACVRMYDENDKKWYDSLSGDHGVGIVIVETIPDIQLTLKVEGDTFTTNQLIRFTAEGAPDDRGSYAWSVDGNPIAESGKILETRFLEEGMHEVSVTYTYKEGVTFCDSRTITVIWGLSGSVGVGCANNTGDVFLLKRRLSELGFDWIGAPDDVFDDWTCDVIDLFQSIIYRRYTVSGDGRVDVPGPENGAYAWLQAQNAPRWQSLSLGGQEGDGFKKLVDGDEHDFGTDWLDATIVGAGQAYQQNYRRVHPNAAVMSINDASLPVGGNTGDHSEHETGLQFDLQIPRTDGISGGNITPEDSKLYDREAMHAMLQALKDQPLRVRVIFNDDTLHSEGLCEMDTTGVHDNHAHIDIKPPNLIRR
ncbi:MAG: hypothetical protein KJ065_19320 [Anaerolineae bacterium]|nr:hypothetical protein [Anaerolineae bacterium]